MTGREPAPPIDLATEKAKRILASLVAARLSMDADSLRYLLTMPEQLDETELRAVLAHALTLIADFAHLAARRGDS